MAAVEKAQYMLLEKSSPSQLQSEINKACRDGYSFHSVAVHSGGDLTPRYTAVMVYKGPPGVFLDMIEVSLAVTALEQMGPSASPLNQAPIEGLIEKLQAYSRLAFFLTS